MPFAGFKGLVLPTILVTLLLLFLADLIDKRFSFYTQRVDEEMAGSRFHSVDGLRGFLAIAVMYHHCVISYFFYATGHWNGPPSHLATLYGQGGVAFFFMITAMLFWHRALNSNGRLDLQKFYWSRVMRITPMYLLSASLLILTALAFTHFRLNDTSFQVLKDSFAWLSFTFFGMPDINQFKDTALINTVFWTLVYEWRFYFIFPLMALFSRGVANWILMLITALAIYWYSTINIEWYFVFGALVASILFKFPCTKRYCATPFASLVAIGLLGTSAIRSTTAYSPEIAPLLFGAFLIVAGGNTLFGVLTSRPARVLGTISYSIYLLHNFLLYIIFRAVNHFTPIPQIAMEKYWLIIAGIATLTVGLSAITYRYVEFPYIRRKQPRWLTGGVREKLQPVKSP